MPAAGNLIIKACTRKLGENEPGANGVPGLKHCFLKVEYLDGRRFRTLSYGPDGAGAEHYPNAPSAKCDTILNPVGGITWTDDEVQMLTDRWIEELIRDPDYSVLHNNCCTKVINTLTARGMPVPDRVNKCNLRQH